ncbi:MAG: AI-2E family transporter [bacterium]
MQKHEYPAVAVFAAIVVISCYLFYIFFKPFIIPILWGAVLAGFFHPLDALLARRIKKRNLRAVIMCIAVVSLIVVPAVFMAIGLINQVANLFPRFEEAVTSGRLDFIIKPESFEWNRRIQDALSRYIDLSKFNTQRIMEDLIEKLNGFLLLKASGFVTNLPRTIASFGLSVLSMFFFFRDGTSLTKAMKEVLPMSEELKQSLISEMGQIMVASLYGSLLVAAFQGILGGLIFFVLGIPAPILWGSVMAVLSLLPIVGPYLIYVPAAIMLILTGSYLKGIILIILGATVVSQSDNLLRPMIIGSRTKMHTMVLFFSIIGGVKTFGLIGLLLGPLVASVVFTFVRFYKVTLPQIDRSFPQISEDQTMDRQSQG